MSAIILKNKGYFQAMAVSIEGYIGLFLIGIISWACEHFDKDNGQWN
ncbi:MAG: hypothetical protein IIC84_01480 [Chloroflexi bacterium]|nr:hypothetical protein [Chloroflexota bacterium]